MKTLKELADLVKGELIGPADVKITGVAGIEHVQENEITFVSKVNMLGEAEECPAAAVIMPKSLPNCKKPTIKVENPRLAFALVLEIFNQMPAFKPGIDKGAIIGNNPALGKDIYIGPFVCIGNKVKIGNNTVIHPGVIIEDEVEIGDNCIIRANVVIYYKCKIGNKVIIHSGSIIGSDGFGYVTLEDKKHYKVPQAGIVVIEDEVEIGANVTIDRATTGVTLIKRGTKIDNLVQIAHNVTIGECSIIVAMAGIAGSSKIGDRVTLAGQTGIVGHISIGDDSIVAGRGLVISNLPANSFVSGQPARPHAEDMRILATTAKIPELLKTIRNLEKRIAELETKIIN